MPGELLQNMTTLPDLVASPNLITGGWFWTAILACAFFVVFFALNIKGRSVKSNVIASTFFIAIIALIAGYAGLVEFKVFIILQTILSFGTIAFYNWMQN